MALKSLLVKDVPQLEKAMDHTVDFIDIDYEVCDPKNTPTSSPWTARRVRQTVMKGGRAIANAYRLWLQSSEYDYIRKPGFGGFFRNNLNDRWPFSPESEEAIKSSLIKESNDRWPDLVILECTVKCGAPVKKWVVHIEIADKLNGLPIDSIDTDVAV